MSHSTQTACESQILACHIGQVYGPRRQSRDMQIRARLTLITVYYATAGILEISIRDTPLAGCLRGGGYRRILLLTKNLAPVILIESTGTADKYF